MQQDMINKVMRFEAGENMPEGPLSVAELTAMFTTLIETGELWVLPDSYLNNAAILIQTGAIQTPPSKKEMN